MAESVRDYNREYRDLNNKCYAYDFDYVLRRFMLRRFAPWMKPGKALELGCHKGDFTRMLAEHYTELTVVEAADELIEVARKRVPATVRFLHATFEQAWLVEEFDSVFLVHTLEHLDDPQEVLRKIGGWLKPDGMLFVVVPNANAVSRQIAVKMGLISHNSAVTEAERIHGHRVTYSFDTLERDVLGAGLKIAERGGIFFKVLANFQMDKLIQSQIVDEGYLEGCYALGMQYPDLCASIYLLCTKGT